MKSVFITGGTSGIGKALTNIYLQRGYLVGICGRKSEKFAESFPNPPDHLYFYQLDVSEREKLKESVREFTKLNPDKELNLFIANAGISSRNKGLAINFDRAEKVIQVNLLGVLYSFEAAVDIMRPQKSGKIVVVTSLAGLISVPGTAAYCSSKAGAIKMAESFEYDLRPLGITVLTQFPGFIDTPLTKINKHPMPLMITAENAAEKMVKAIDKNISHFYFPFFTATSTRIFALLPNSFHRFIMNLLMTKFFPLSKKTAKQKKECA